MPDDDMALGCMFNVIAWGKLTGELLGKWGRGGAIRRINSLQVRSEAWVRL